MFELSLYTALALTLVGMWYQFYRFKKQTRFFNEERKGHPGTTSFFKMVESALNTLFQIKLFKAGKIRWAVHFFVFTGFLYLLIVHALHDLTSSFLFAFYEPTADPFQFLRNLSGFIVLAGCACFLGRRLINIRINRDKDLRYKGVFMILLITLVISSGFSLEAFKIVSEPVFMEMVEEYSDLDNETGLEDLKIFWQENYHVVFQKSLKSTRDMLDNGTSLNEEYCLSCHSPVKSAFFSWVIAREIKPMGKLANDYRFDQVFYWIHYFFCLLLFVSFRFSKLFHILLIPWAGIRKEAEKDDLILEKGHIDASMLYACTNCGFCSEVCSVYPNFQINGNMDVLPHSKLASVKQMIQGPFKGNWLRLHSGNAACTMCHKCTDICPSGIDLQALWHKLDQKLASMGYWQNPVYFNSISLTEWARTEPHLALADSSAEMTTTFADRISSFEGCIQCTICTNVCPVVEHDSNQNDMTPQQVMNLLRLGKKHLASGSRMVWNCLTCYACQENCPRQIRVTDIILELRNSVSIKRNPMDDETL